jgi:hypothetical protein
MCSSFAVQLNVGLLHSSCVWMALGTMRSIHGLHGQNLTSTSVLLSIAGMLLPRRKLRTPSCCVLRLHAPDPFQTTQTARFSGRQLEVELCALTVILRTP